MASGITFNGLGSGIDFGALTDSIIAQRTRPITQIQVKQSNLRGRSEALKQLNARLLTLTEAANALKDRALGSGRVATSTDSTIVSTTTTDAAAAATIKLNVGRLASAYSQASSPAASASAPLLAGGDTAVTFKLRRGGVATADDPTITIDAAANSQNNSLEGLRDAINSKNFGVTATIVSVDGGGTQNRLVLSSTKTGAVERVQLVDDANSATFTSMGLSNVNPPGAMADLDAQLNVNGLTVTRPSNEITDVVSGVTFNLKKLGAADITVAANTTAVADKLTTFVNAYNAVQEFVNTQQVPDASGKPTGALAGDPTLQSVQRQLREALNKTSSTTANGGALTDLTQIGIGRDANGKVTLDRTLLNDKLKTSFGDVQALLSGKTALHTGLANSIYTTYNSLSDGVTGVVQNAINGYNTTVTSLDKSIFTQQERLEALRISLTRQFAAADAAIGQLNGQGTSLTSIIKSLEPRS